jgi:hypothetical protein
MGRVICQQRDGGFFCLCVHNFFIGLRL